jgi:hypothetical protein
MALFSAGHMDTDDDLMENGGRPKTISQWVQCSAAYLVMFISLQFF